MSNDNRLPDTSIQLRCSQELSFRAWNEAMHQAQRLGLVGAEKRAVAPFMRRMLLEFLAAAPEERNRRIDVGFDLDEEPSSDVPSVNPKVDMPPAGTRSTDRDAPGKGQPTRANEPPMADDRPARRARKR